MGVHWHLKRAMARFGIRLLKASGFYDGYWNHWRGELFEFAEQRGLHILPVHYYSPIPRVALLPEDLWDDKSECIGINLRLDDGEKLLSRIGSMFGAEFTKFRLDPDDDPRVFYLSNGAYGPGDAEILYGMIRDLKPARIVEIGCGYSTLVASMAIARNAEDDASRSCAYTCIEPYLPSYLDPSPAFVTEVIKRPVQDVPFDVFESLEAGDILFIDSTHVVSQGSDTLCEYLQILPRLKSGVVVHIHDIFLPNEYPKVWAQSARFFWNEQYLLQAFLLYNHSFEVLLASHAIARLRPSVFAESMPLRFVSDNFPSSFWMKKV